MASVKNAHIHYLYRIIKNIESEKQKNQIKNMFDKHMEEITFYCINNFIEKDILTESFIKGLHKILFPPGYTESKKTLSGDGEYIYMIPGVYKILQNFDWIAPKDVKYEMKKLIKNYNNNIEIQTSKFDFIIKTYTQFIKIHPFGNGNGRVASILVDLLLVKNNLPPICLNNIQNTYRNNYIEILIDAILKKDVTELKSYILQFTNKL